MKTHILTTAFLLASVAASAQCDIHKKTDQYTNKVNYWTNRVKITDGGVTKVLRGSSDKCRYKIYFQFMAQNGKLYVSLTEDSDDCTCSATSMSLKLNDGTVIIKSNPKEGVTRKTTLGDETPVYFEITKEELELLSVSPVSRFKVAMPYCSDHPVLDEKIEEGLAAEIKEAATCVNAIKQ